VAPEAVSELDWWEEVSPLLEGPRVVAVPARHFSGRGLLDRNTRLWCAYAILGKDRRVFFGGDGGLFDGFAEIGAAFGPFDLTALEIGASDPAWESVHLGPVHAVIAHRMLRGQVLLPIHWATFNLGLHAWDAPGETVLLEAEKAGIRLALPRIGQWLTLGNSIPSSPWWREA
jgi:L-ascorbate metabolism protein UlaG (beta-lactamase superfamily)